MTDVRREPSCSAKPADNKINGGMTQPVINSAVTPGGSRWVTSGWFRPETARGRH